MDTDPATAATAGELQQCQSSEATATVQSKLAQYLSSAATAGPAPAGAAQQQDRAE